MTFGLALVLAASIPFVLSDHRMFVQAYVDGSGPWSMIVDTGSFDLVVTPQVARRLRLRTGKQQYVTGAGNGAAASSSTTVHTLRVGNLVLPSGHAEVIDLARLAKSIGFRRLDGIVGYAQLKDFRVLADVDRRQLTFSRSPIAAPKEAATAPFTVGDDDVIRTSASVDGVRGRFIVDTGDRSSVTLFRGFATANDFYSSASIHNVVTGYGIGGPIFSDLLRTTFDLFGVTMPDVPTRLSRDLGGVFAASSDAGSIGNGLLERFNVIYDYPDSRLIAWPARSAPADTSLFHLPVIPAAPSGTLLRHATFGAAVEAKAGGVSIARVLPDSAAALAGFQPGDVLRSIGGEPIVTANDFLRSIHDFHAGDHTNIELTRTGRQITLPVALGSAADEHDSGVTTTYDAVTVDNTLRRTILTAPDSATGRLPALLLIGGIGCSSVDVAANPQDAYLRVTHDISRAGFVTMRLEKSGIGDSQGPPCRNVDFEGELRGYRAALTSLLANPGVDPSRVYLLGHSIGSVIVPRLALEHRLAGTIVAEGVGRDWPEYELRNTRRQLELGGLSAADVDAGVLEKSQCLQRLLFEDEPEAKIEELLPSCKDHNGVYPVTASYMQQVAHLNVIAPWTLVDAPVLALYGASDFVTEEADHQRIVSAVNAAHHGPASFVRIDGMSHLLTRATSAAAAYSDSNAGVAEPYDGAFSAAIIAWLRGQSH